MQLPIRESLSTMQGRQNRGGRTHFSNQSESCQSRFAVRNSQKKFLTIYWFVYFLIYVVQCFQQIQKRIYLNFEEIQTNVYQCNVSKYEDVSSQRKSSLFPNPVIDQVKPTQCKELLAFSFSSINLASCTELTLPFSTHGTAKRV